MHVSHPHCSNRSLPRPSQYISNSYSSFANHTDVIEKFVDKYVIKNSDKQQYLNCIREIGEAEFGGDANDLLASEVTFWFM